MASIDDESKEALKVVTDYVARLQNANTALADIERKRRTQLAKHSAVDIYRNKANTSKKQPPHAKQGSGLSQKDKYDEAIKKLQGGLNTAGISDALKNARQENERCLLQINSLMETLHSYQSQNAELLVQISALKLAQGK